MCNFIYNNSWKKQIAVPSFKLLLVKSIKVSFNQNTFKFVCFISEFQGLTARYININKKYFKK